MEKTLTVTTSNHTEHTKQKKQQIEQRNILSIHQAKEELELMLKEQMMDRMKGMR